MNNYATERQRLLNAAIRHQARAADSYHHMVKAREAGDVEAFALFSSDQDFWNWKSQMFIERASILHIAFLPFTFEGCIEYAEAITGWKAVKAEKIVVDRIPVINVIFDDGSFHCWLEGDRLYGEY